MLEGVERLIDLTGFCASLDAAPQTRHAARGHSRRRYRDAGGGGRSFRRHGARRADGAPRPHHRRAAALLRGEDVPRPVPGGGRPASTRIFEWCQRQRIGWQFEPPYTRMIPAHYLVELDQVGCPDPMPRYRRFFEPAVAQGPADVDEPGAAYVQRGLSARCGRGWPRCRRASRSPWRSPGAWTARRSGCWPGMPQRTGPRSRRRPRVHARLRRRRRCGAGRRRGTHAGPRGVVGARRRAGVALRPARGDRAPSRTTTRSTSSARPPPCACCAASASAIRRCATSWTATAATRT